MSKSKKSKKNQSNSVLVSAGRFANRNARNIGLAGVGVVAGAAAVLLGRRYGWRGATGGGRAGGEIGSAT